MLLLNTGLGNDEEQLKVKELLNVAEPVITDDACKLIPILLSFWIW